MKDKILKDEKFSLRLPKETKSQLNKVADMKDKSKGDLVLQYIQNGLMSDIEIIHHKVKQ